MRDIVEITQRDDLLDIVLCDAENGNLVSNEAGDKIAARLDALDPAVKLVRIRSNGLNFCLGRVSPMPAPGASASGLDLKKRLALPALRVYEAIRHAPVPVICAVRGAALGYGCGLAAASDIVIAAEEAVFQIPEMERGIPPTLVMTAIARSVPSKAIAWMVLSREKISAAQARDWGLVSKVVPGASLEAEVETLTSMVLASPLESISAIKEFLLHMRDTSGQALAGLAANLAATALSQRFMGVAKP
jgi:enoyl-CoA hydratase